MTDLLGSCLRFDCSNGAAGDMILAALFDVGVPREIVDSALASMDVSPSRLQVNDVSKKGIRSLSVSVDDSGQTTAVTYKDICARLRASSLAEDIVELSLAIFTILGKAEAKIHSTSLDAVHFHEVGAIDSLVDIVGAAAAVQWIGPHSIQVLPIGIGGGTQSTSHGVLPIPAPATLEILRSAGLEVRTIDEDKECCTPTGAAILAALVHKGRGNAHGSAADEGEQQDLDLGTYRHDRQSGALSMGTGAMQKTIGTSQKILASGYGAGKRDSKKRPNVLRIIALSAQAQGMWTSAPLVEMVANIDDMPAETLAYVSEQLMRAGAMDVWSTPIVMKKGRAAVCLSVLAGPQQQTLLMDIMARESTTLGVRVREVMRHSLSRQAIPVETPYGVVPVVAVIEDGQLIRASPEYEVCKEIARTQGIPLRQVYSVCMTNFERSYVPKN